MSLVSATWDFVKRNKGKLVIAGAGVGGFIYLNRFMSSFEKKWETSASRDFVSEVRKKETHFENTIQTCNSTCTSLAPKIVDILNSALGAEPVLAQIKSNPENKLELWEELKIRIFTRVISEVYCLCLLVCYLRVQLSVIAGYIYVDSNRNGGALGAPSSSSSSSLINQNIQMKYLSLLNAFYQEGIQEIIKPVQESVQHALQPYSLKEKLVVQDLKNIFDKVKASMAFSLAGPNSHASQYLIKPEKITETKGSQGVDEFGDLTPTPLTSKDVAILQKMLGETQDILESDDFVRVLDSSVEIGFSVVMDLLLGCFVRMEMSGSAPAENGFSNPHSVHVPLAKLLPSIDNALMKRKKPEEQLVLVRHLLCLDVLNCFAANIYEAFCEPDNAGK